MVSRNERVLVEEHEHALLVRGTIDIETARAIVGKRDPGAEMLPCRPVTLGGDPCVAFYFAYGPEENFLWTKDEAIERERWIRS